jgi:pimeloyl-ACP methyl ester carboxylesterase
VIDKGSVTESHPVPLLFVHGAWHGAWCWDEHFLNFFADKGYRAVALSLRGHGKSPAPKPMQFCSIADFVDDVDAVAASLPTRPVVVGHSMGGFVVQKYLESHEAPAGVLLASEPPRGARGFLLRFLKRHPWRCVRGFVTMRSLHNFNTPERARHYFYSEKTPDADVVRYTALLDEEFTGRITLDQTVRNLPETDRITAPILVLGAACDGCFTTDEVNETARAYRTQAEIFPDMGHNMMLEPGWAEVAERIDGWLLSLGLGAERQSPRAAEPF